MKAVEVETRQRDRNVADGMGSFFFVVFCFLFSFVLFFFVLICAFVDPPRFCMRSL